MNPLIVTFIGFGLFGGLVYAMGNLVYHKNVKVNYTRKVCHFGLFFIPIFSGYFFLGSADTNYFFLGVFSILIFIHPWIRNKSSILQRSFLAIDRPEDRPHTVRWFYTQAVLTAFSLFILTVIAWQVGVDWDGINLLLIPLAAVGDGFAEPIGVRFGKHRYKAYSLFPLIRNKYYRTLEGSAAVYVSTIFVLLVYRGFFTQPQFTIVLISIPVIVTIAEAISPHTQDSALLNFLPGLGIILIKYFI